MSLFHKIKLMFISEIAERLPWALIAYICGILIGLNTWISAYLYPVLALAFLSGLMWLWMRKKIFVSWYMMILSMCSVGIINISLHAQMNKHPILLSPLYHKNIQATVLENRLLIDKQIVTLTDIHWHNPDLKRPQKIRVHFKEKIPLLNVGDRIKTSVSVYPPKGPSEKNLWFQQIGAIGIADKMEIIFTFPKQNFSFSKIRHQINQHLFEILSLSQAEIAAPLITGEQKLISHNTYQTYRRAGIAHVLSVSGFHMALLASFLFFMIRGICAIFPRIALYWNTKKIAAVASLIGSFLYLGLSGFQVPALRAFIMIAFVFVGVLIDRSVISMRTLILTALGILICFPQMILSVSFQFSFIAVAVLVMLCSYIQDQPWSKYKKAVIGFIGLNVFVSLALIPFIAFYFHQLTPYGILGNMLFNSIFSFFIMPLLFVGALTMPFGWDVPFFRLAGLGLKGVDYGANQLAGLPYSELTIPSFSPIALGMIGFGIMGVCFMKTPLKWSGMLLIILGIIGGLFP